MIGDNLCNINKVIQNEINNNYISGASLNILHKQSTILSETYGLADLASRRPVTRDTIFRMHSLSKPITAVAAMILSERGQLNLLSSVSEYLEGFKNQRVLTKYGLADVDRPVTIRDLLNMASGIVYPEDTYTGRLMRGLFDEAEKAHYNGHPIRTVEFCNRMGEIPLAFQPGESWCYGASADILGAVIEVVTGKRYSDFLMDEIFSPLNMKDTAFYVPEEKRSRFAQIYDYNADQKKLEPFTEDFLAVFDYMEPPAFESGGAGLVSTMDDYTNFATMLANGGTLNDTRILGRKTIDYLTSPQLNPEQLKAFNWDSLLGYNYANFCRIMVDPAKAASNGSTGEYGWDGWCGNYFFIDPKEELIMLYMVQRCGGSGYEYIRKLRSIVYSSL